MQKDLLESIIGKVIKVNRGGPESKIGKLLSVSEDFFILLTEEDGVIYFANRHVKSITENSKNNLKFPLKVPRDFSFKTSHCFTSLLDNLKSHWVKVNCGGPEKLEGVLLEANNDYITVVSHEEVVRFFVRHIKNISYGLKIPKRKEEKKCKDKGKDDDK